MTEIDTIVSELRAASSAYYNSDAPVMADAAFDALRDQLVALDPQHPFLSEVGAPVAHGRRKVKHTIAMMSLHKITKEKEVGAWLNKLPAGSAIAVQPKLDGGSVSLQYVDGVLKEAASRGNGAIGEDLMVVASRMPSIPKTIGLDGNVSVRGEVVLLKADWPKVSNYDPTKNPRNAGNGVMRRDDGTDAEHLTFVAFDLAANHDGEHEDFFKFTVAHQTVLLAKCGFTHVAETHVVESSSDLHDVIGAWEARRPDLEYAIDGLVFKANDLAVSESMGVSSGRPNGQIAWKWASDTAETEVVGVELTVGHTGLISPTFKLKPVELMGVTVSNALGNNWNEISRLGGIQIGDTVEVFRAGEIIPKISRLIAKGAVRTPITEPTQCPCCSGPAGRINGGANTYCLSDECSAKTTGKVKRWIKSLDILGIGDEVLAGLCAEGGPVTDAASLYHLTPEILEFLPVGNGKLGLSRAKSIVAAIQAKKRLTLDEVLGSLGVQHLGKRRVQIVRELAGGKLDTLEAWLDGTTLLQVAAQCQIAGMAPAIVKGLEDVGSTIQRLLWVLPAPTAPAPAVKAKEGAFVFVLTGTMSRGRKEIAADIVAAGHATADDVKAGVTHLVQADPTSASSKSKKAAKLGIPTISEADLLALLGK